MSSPEGATARPLHKLRRGDRCDDRATVGAKPETSVNKLLFAGSRMSVFPSGAFPVFERASILRSASKDGREFPLPWLRSRRCTRSVFTGPCPGAGSLRNCCNVPLTPLGRPALLGHRTGGSDRAVDGPDEPRELARDRGDGDGLQLAPSDQRPVTPVQATLRLPGDLANRTRGSRDLLLFLLAYPRRMLIAPGAFHQHTARAPVTGLGDRAAPDLVAGRMLRWHQAKISH